MLSNQLLNKLFRVVLFMLCITLAQLTVNAQVSIYYIWSQSTSTYTPGFPTGVATPANVFAQDWDDDVTVYPLPFAFNFNGTTYPATTGYIGLDSDGWFTFSNGVPTMTGAFGGGSWVSINDHTGVYLYGDANNNGFAGFNADLNAQNLATFTGTISSGSIFITGVSSFVNVRIGTRLNATGIPAGSIVTAFDVGAGTITLSTNASATGSRTITPSASIFAFTRGTAPNRQFVVQWTQTKRYNLTPITGDNFNFQMILNEGGGVASLQTLQVVYGDFSATNTANLDAQVGLRGASAADFNARTSLTAWASTTAATSNNQHVRFRNTIVPASGLTYTWSPCTTAPAAAGVITGNGTVCPATNHTYTLPLVSNATFYVWSYSGSGATFTDTTLFPSNTFNYSSLSTGGTLTVTPGNLCGNGTAATRAITVTSITPATISYPTAIICTSAGPTNVTRVGTAGGTYTATPAGLTINASSGQINPLTSTTGSYTITYTYTSSGCSGLTTTTAVSIEGGPPVALNPSNALDCIGSNFNLQAIGVGNYNVQSVAHSMLTPSGSPTVVWNTYQDDAMSGAIAIPFTFNYFGNNTTQLYISTNGYIQLQNNSANSTFPQTLPTAANPNNIIALCWEDLVIDPSTHPGANIRYYTNGTAPNRIMIIEFNSLRFLGGLSSENVTGQIRLYEGSNNIEIAVSSIDDDGNNYDKTLGIENATGTQAVSPTGRNNTGFQASNETWRFALSNNFSYAWSPATYLSNTTISNPVASNVLTSINYTVRVTNTVSGCFTDSIVSINVAAPLNGTYTVGGGGNFPTLTAAVQAYNTLCLGGHVIFSLIDANYTTSEMFPIVIRSNPDADANHTLTIKPATGVIANITGNNASGIIQFSGADYVTIDGANTTGGGTRNLTIKNNSTSSSNSAVVWMYPASVSNGNNHITIQHTIIQGNSRTTTNCGIISSGFGSFGSVSEIANNNYTFHNNQFNLSLSGIVLVGASGNDQNNRITFNDFGGTTNATKMGWSAIEIYQQANAEISKNKISGIYTTSTSIDVSGIVLLGTHNGVNITQNTINDVRHNSNYGAHGIFLASSSSAANITVANNFISNIASAGFNGFSSSDNGYGIVVEFGGGYKIWFNTISIYANTSNTGAHKHAAMLVTSTVTNVGAIDLRNNIFSITQTNGNANSRYAMICLAANNVFSSNNYNVYWSSSNNLLSRGTATNYTTLAALQANIGGNTNSILVQPNFTNIANGDLHLVAASNNSISNAGQTISGISLDIDSTTRNALTPDIGADEFVTPNYGSWVGRVSTDWTNPFNWEANFVPVNTTDVQIRGGFTNMPTVTTVQPMRNLALSTGVPGSPPILTLNGGTIQVYGVMSYGGGTIDGQNGSLEMMATSAQTIPAGIFLNNNLLNLIISNEHVATGVSLGGALDVYRSVTFTTNGRRLATNGHLTFKSTATQTAWLGDVTGKVIVGDATVERYIHTGTGAGMHPKAWQFLSVPTSGTQTIKAAWQEGAATPNANPVAGFGTQITSNLSGATTLGFDVFTAPGPSLKTYNATTNVWQGLPNTITQTIPNAKGYMIFVRGDRSVITHTASAVPTVLRTKGTLYTTGINAPPTTTVTAGRMESVGNPYPSAIDFRQLNRTNLSDVFYLWDPYLTTVGNSAWGLGGYQTFTLSGSDYIVTPGGGNFGAPGSVNNLIQSGQAFFVQSSQPLGGTNGSISFAESAKVSGSTLVNRNVNIPVNQLRTSLYAMNNGELQLIDGVLHQFDVSYTNKVNGADARKLQNTGENLSLYTDSQHLVVERRALPLVGDTLFMQLTNTRTATYQFTVDATDFQMLGMVAFLEDTWLQTYTLIAQQGITHYTFEINNQPESKAANRFRFVFKTLSPLPVSQLTLTAIRNTDKSHQLTWEVLNEYDLEKYILEKSTDGIEYVELGVVLPIPTSHNIKIYHFTNRHPFVGNNFYRVKAISINGMIQYSNVAHLASYTAPPTISVYPNPIVLNNFHIQFNNIPDGIYQLRMINTKGQEVWHQSMRMMNSGLLPVDVKNILSKGTYSLVLTGNGIRLVTRMMKQ